MKLHNLIFLGMVLGLLLGLGLYFWYEPASTIDLRFQATFEPAAAAQGRLVLREQEAEIDINATRPGVAIPVSLEAGRQAIEFDGRVTRNEARRHDERLLRERMRTEGLTLVFVPDDPSVPAVRADSFSATIVQRPDRTVTTVYDHAIWWLDLLGPTIFMGALKMIIAPLIFASIVAGVTSLPHLGELGAIGWKTLAYYIGTTTIAVTIGLVAVLTVQPGKKPASQAERERRVSELAQLRLEYRDETGESPLDPGGEVTPEYRRWVAAREGARQAAGGAASQYEVLTSAEGRTPGEIFKQDIVQPLLTNPFTSLAASPPNALGIIFFALLFGIACTFVGEAAKPVVGFFYAVNEVIMQITHWLMTTAPLAIGCIVAKLVAETGPAVFESLGWYSGTVIGGIIVHLIALLLICRFIGGVGPWRLWRGIREAYLVAFSTRSSAATLPITIENVTENLDVSPKVANFSLPLGATMNMDGTALYEGIAVIFLIQIYGGLDDVAIQMTPITTFLIFITAVLASVGAAAVPSAGLVTMVIVASAVNLPIYYIPLIFAVDAILDMFRTSTNVLGDSVGAIVVNRLERGKLGEAIPAAT